VFFIWWTLFIFLERWIGWCILSSTLGYSLNMVIWNLLSALNCSFCFRLNHVFQKNVLVFLSLGTWKSLFLQRLALFDWMNCQHISNSALFKRRWFFHGFNSEGIKCYEDSLKMILVLLFIWLWICIQLLRFKCV
jgi:uncharacterized protein YqhQ